MPLIAHAIAAATLAIAAGNSFASSLPDFGDGMRATAAAWLPTQIVDSRTIAIRGPRVQFCGYKPTLETVVTEGRSRIVVDAYVVRPTGLETHCLKEAALKARMKLSRPIGGRALYDGLYSPPRLRLLPPAPGKPVPSASPD